MRNSVLWRRVLPVCLMVCVLAAVFAVGVVIGQKKNKYGMPTSVIHLVALRWKAEATPEQRQKAIDGIKTMAAEIPGIKNIWLKPLRVQNLTQDQKLDTIFVIEFESEAAAEAYRTNPKHEEWSKQLYEPYRDTSRSFQATNEAPASAGKKK
ncbi:MAG TPA: Dabb family protein [Blastocatellia bacterium]|nr:Dabb family protein [Blastocatellia bacterium]